MHKGPLRWIKFNGPSSPESKKLVSASKHKHKFVEANWTLSFYYEHYHFITKSKSEKNLRLEDLLIKFADDSKGAKKKPGRGQKEKAISVGCPMEIVTEVENAAQSRKLLVMFRIKVSTSEEDNDVGVLMAKDLTPADQSIRRLQHERRWYWTSIIGPITATVHEVIKTIRAFRVISPCLEPQATGGQGHLGEGTGEGVPGEVQRVETRYEWAEKKPPGPGADLQNANWRAILKCSSCENVERKWQGSDQSGIGTRKPYHKVPMPELTYGKPRLRFTPWNIQPVEQKNDRDSKIRKRTN